MKDGKAVYSDGRKEKIPFGIEDIDLDVYQNYEDIESIILPDSVKEISRLYFSGDFCDGISVKEIYIPESVEAIGEYAFAFCKMIKEIRIPKSVTYIANNAFYMCDSLEKIVVDSENPVYHSEGNCIIHTESRAVVCGCNHSVIPNGITGIGDGAFCSCRILDGISVPEGVTVIGNRAFAGCASFTELYIPKSVEIIGDGAFANCAALEKISVSPENTAYHDKNGCLIHTESKTILRGCNGSVIPDDGSVINIGAGAFEHCEKLSEIRIPDCILSIGEYAFAGCHELIKAEIPESVAYIGDNAFCNCRSLREVNIEGKIERIGGYMFFGCVLLTSVNIPESVRYIGRHAFCNCLRLENLILPEKLEEIEFGVFFDCRLLTELNISKTVKSIGAKAFFHCKALTVNYDGTYEEWKNIYPEDKVKVVAKS